MIDQAEASSTTEDGATPNALQDEVIAPELRTNKNIVDNPANQKLTMAEIEALKQDKAGNSKELIAKILQSHSSLDQKTAFSLAKYTLRKQRKYLKRFSVLPLDVMTLTDWMMNDREFAKVMEIRNEVLGLMGCWANVHASGIPELEQLADIKSCRYLMIDDTGGVVVAAMAERMGILHAPAQSDLPPNKHNPPDTDQADNRPTSPTNPKPFHHPEELAMSAPSNTITLLHANSQPNLSLLRYFNYDVNIPTPTHPLYTHLKTLSWLQLLCPESDPISTQPETIPAAVLATWKPSKRSTHYRKHRRWARTRAIISATRAGGFDGLIIASWTNPVSILHHLVPFLAGGAQVTVYSPHIEPLVQLADCYSTARRTAFINTPEIERKVPSEDFPVDPTLLLAPMLQTARVRRWQVLPGRTHPRMMSRGGAEGYVFVGTRVLPAEGKVEARGKVGGKRRRVEVESGREGRDKGGGGGTGVGVGVGGMEGVVGEQMEVLEDGS